jgi:AcrR family transcriptional regulator
VLRPDPAPDLWRSETLEYPLSEGEQGHAKVQKTYTAEFKREAVQLVQTSGKPIAQAARELLMESTSFSGFSIEAVARRADVTRMTIYHQFGSKIGLLEALCDSLAVTGEMEQLASAFRQPDPWEGLDEYIRIFGHFREADRPVTRRLEEVVPLVCRLAHAIPGLEKQA